MPRITKESIGLQRVSGPKKKSRKIVVVIPRRVGTCPSSIPLPNYAGSNPAWEWLTFISYQFHAMELNHSNKNCFSFVLCRVYIFLLYRIIKLLRKLTLIKPI